MTATPATAQPEDAPLRLNAKGLWTLFKEAAKDWSEDKAPRLGAALAYYTVFSLAPLLILIIAIVGLTLGQREVAQEAVVSQLRGLVGPEGAQVVETAIENSSKPATAILAGVIGVITLLLGALGAFGQLQDALNTIWEVKPRPGRGLRGIIKDRVLSLGLVLVIGFFLVVSLGVSAALTTLGAFLGTIVPGPEIVMEGLNFIISLAVITVLFALMYKYLPDAKIAWRDVWVGAVSTALLFTIGKTLIGLYLGRGSITSTYGAAGSFVVLLVWLYYSAQIFLFGAELTQVYANRFGKRVRPTDNAVPVTAAERANEGTPGKKEEPALAGQMQPAPGTAAPSRTGEGQTLPVVGPFVPLPGIDEEQAGRGTAVVAGEPWRQALERRGYLLALLTFAAGLGAGAMVALGSARPAAAPPKRRPKLEQERNDRRRR